MPGVAGMFANQQPVGPKPKRAKPVPKRQPFAEFKVSYSLCTIITYNVPLYPSGRLKLLKMHVWLSA